MKDTTLGSGPNSWADVDFVLERLGRTVQMSEVESGAVYEYQAEIDRAIGLG